MRLAARRPRILIRRILGCLHGGSLLLRRGWRRGWPQEVTSGEQPKEQQDGYQRSHLVGRESCSPPQTPEFVLDSAGPDFHRHERRGVVGFRYLVDGTAGA